MALYNYLIPTVISLPVGYDATVLASVADVAARLKGGTGRKVQLMSGARGGIPLRPVPAATPVEARCGRGQSSHRGRRVVRSALFMAYHRRGPALRPCPRHTPKRKDLP